MGIDARVPRGARQVLVLTVGDMEMGLGVAVFLRETKVDNVDLVAPLSDTHQKVVGLHVTVDKVSRVNVFYP